MNNVSATNGPIALMLRLFKDLIAGIIIFFSSDFSLNSALCGLRPNMPIFGFFFQKFFIPTVNS